jgi:hypothetical protein
LARLLYRNRGRTVPIHTISELIQWIERNPDICGLEEVLMDNLMPKPANCLDNRFQDRKVSLLIYHDPAVVNSMPAHRFVKSLKMTTGIYGLTPGDSVFIDDIMSLPKPITLNPCLINGVIYLRYVES